MRVHIASDGDPVGVDETWWQAIQANLARAEYAATPTSAGLQAPNRAHNLRTTFGERGIEVMPRTGKDVAPAWQFAWETSGFGRTGSMNAVARATPESEGNRVTYRRDGWTEWYENTAKGLEQGFMIRRRPAGEGPLRIAGEFPGTLRAELREDGAIDFIDSHGACALRYGELHVWDARGEDLRSELVVAGNELAIVIDDLGAEYPLMIDPLMTSPAWTAEPNQASALMGFSVATAGDVNWDGFSDVIVGAWGYDNGETDEGRAFVYHGSPTGLSVAPNWTAESDHAGALFGFSVATAGDVNGDGFADVIVGAFRYDGGQADEGRAYVYHGSAAGLSSIPNWTAESDQAFADFGTRVATAGDTNGDGFDDVIVGAPFFDNDLSNEGRAFVYFGSSGGLEVSPGWTGESNQTGAQFGNSVATAGDVNGDGFADLIVGAVIYANGESNEGRAFAFHGGAGGPSATPNWTAEGNQANAFFATSVAGAGDVNGDGFADVIVGAPGAFSGQSAEGRAYAYHGSAGGLAGTASWTWEPNLGDSSFGQFVGTAGDINGDGFADVIVGAHNFTNGQFAEGRAFVFQGARLGLWSFPAWTAEGNQASAGFGISVATAGDVNGDGFSDVIVGAWQYDNGQTNEGRAFVYHGSAGGLQTILQWAAEGEQVGGIFGYALAPAGDVNGDGFSDVIVGDYGFDTGQGGDGKIYLFYGSATGLDFTPGWIVESDQIGAALGVSVATAGDVNGDGFSDVIVGAPFYDGGQENEGRVFVYHGSAAGLGSSPAWIAEGNEEDLYFGMSVATAGDVDGDGFSDVIVGAPGFVFLNQPVGWAFVYHGSASGLSATASWSVDGGQEDSNFGASVASAGDVNGDGFSDVIVGASFYSNGEVNEGRAFLYHGSASGLNPTADWTAESNQVTAYFGGSVAGAGDVNGDGFSDVIVGSSYTNGQTGEGRATVYHGSATGLSIANWTAEGDQVHAQFGCSVATAGDVNGDGYSDVIVGAARYDGAFVDQGRALVYHGSSIGLSSAPAKTVEIAQAGADLGRCVATAGDVNGDGYSDVVIGAPQYDGAVGTGLAIGYFGNENDGLDRIPQQARTDDSAPIALLGSSDSPSSFLLKALGRTAAGRGPVRLEIEVKPFGVSFDGSDLAIGATFDTGVPSSGIGSAVPLAELTGGLTAETLYHWRLRIASDSPFFPRSPWFSPAGNALTEADLRTAASQSAGIADEEAPAAGLPVLDPVRPNPLRSHGEIAYTLAQEGRVRLAAYDVSGRQVAVLTDGALAIGRHTVRWDGRDATGHAVPDGVYFVRLETAGRVTSRKLVIAR